MVFLSRWASFRDSFGNSRGGLLFKMKAADIETDDYKTMSKTTTQTFQPRNTLECQVILKKIRNLIIYCLDDFLSMLLLQSQEGGFFSRWASSRD